ncbi:hypothetical protein MHY01S_30200 [Meiothermus hypogaeus NBRC 106114]|uniref:Uncharacterized protein n=1 Tax=Meiothermus hypogaeus NBRC 106114 TaxID=1227553 RepID=A0A511R5G2_9DEIN|nr:hypothetical protein MHY01S_30200 [Meiothermus hypogaeus NBRC 106114]
MLRIGQQGMGGMGRIPPILLAPFDPAAVLAGQGGVDGIQAGALRDQVAGQG